LSEHRQIELTVNHLFRHEAGKMVAVLTRIFGTHNLELAEDIVQETLLSALEQWKINGIPQQPGAWLFVVAKHKALNVIKRQKSQILFGDDQTQILLHSGYTTETTFQKLAEEELIKDDQLRMMFACCHPEISTENQVTLILKTLCGFSTAEIARAFICPEDTVSKRLYRTKEFFRQHHVKLEIPSIEDIHIRIAAVLKAIYLLFNEGYHATDSDDLIRDDMMGESLRLCYLLLDNPLTQKPEVYALLSLICFHAARTEGRISAEGEIILLEEQDRSTWNSELIEAGTAYMMQAAGGDILSTYHLEAAIAYEHCIAPSFAATKWQQILMYYELLNQLYPSPIYLLNGLVAKFQLHGASTALQAVQNASAKENLEKYGLYYSLLGAIFAQLEQRELSIRHFQQAILLSQSNGEKILLQKKLENVLHQS